MMMCRVLAFAVALVATVNLVAGSAKAGETKGKIYSYQTDGKLLSVWVTQNANNHSGSPASCSHPTDGYAVAIDSVIGQNVLSVVISAKQTNLTVSVTGNGSCNVNDTAKEEIRSVTVWGP